MDLKKLMFYLVDQVSQDAKDNFNKMRDTNDWLVAYLVYLFRAVGKKEEVFDLLVGGEEDSNRAYIFKPQTFNELFWKLILTTQGKHDIRFFDAIGQDFTTGAKFICLNLQPHITGKNHLGKESKDILIPELKPFHIHRVMTRNFSFKLLTSSSDKMNNLTEDDINAYNKEVQQTYMNSNNTIVENFFSSAMLKKTLVPFDYKFLHDSYQQMFKSTDEGIKKECNKYWLDKIPSNSKKKGEVYSGNTEFSWWMRYTLVRIYEYFFSLFKEGHIQPNQFLLDCNLGELLKKNRYDLSTDFALSMLGKQINKASGVWRYPLGVNPKFVFLICILVQKVSSGHWKMLNRKFDEYANYDNQSKEKKGADGADGRTPQYLVWSSHQSTIQ